MNDLIERMHGTLSIATLSDARDYLREHRNQGSPVNGMIALYLYENIDAIMLLVLSRGSCTRYELDERVAKWQERPVREITRVINRKNLMERAVDQGLVRIIPVDDKTSSPRLELTEKGVERIAELGGN